MIKQCLITHSMSGVGQGPATASHAMGNLAAAAEVKGRELVH